MWLETQRHFWGEADNESECLGDGLEKAKAPTPTPPIPMPSWPHCLSKNESSFSTAPNHRSLQLVSMALLSG